MEYTGARISAAEADADADDDDPTKRHHTFLFFVSDDIVIDGARDGNEARFINHSCDPNCEIEISRNRVYIHALRSIAPDEELSYDYWYITDESYTMADLRRIYPCRCGSDACRGTLARPPPRKKRRSMGSGADRDARR
jgi:SET domain-containing protein